MNESRSAWYSVITGLAGGLAAWAGVEIILAFSTSFPDLRLLTLSLGAVAGFLLGAIAPAAEGLRQAQKRKVWLGIGIGALSGALGGALGMALGQTILTAIADAAALSGSGLTSWGASLARIPGWTIMGLAVGAATGIRSKSMRRVLLGMAGGFLGGLLGGIAAELLTRISVRSVGRVVGLAFWGVAVAYIADRLDSRSARGRITVLTGPLKGRSFPVNQKRFLISDAAKADLTLAQTGVDSATLVMDKGAVRLEPASGTTVKVNDSAAGVTELRYDDVIKLGETTLLYEARR